MVGSARAVILSVLVLFMLSACSSSSPVRYFSLNPIDAEFRQDPDDAVMLGLGPIRMPEYLNRSQIVTRGANAVMQVDEFSRWSEPLTISLIRVVSADVDNLLQDVVVVAFPYEPLLRDLVDYRLVGDVSRFESDHLGRIVLDIQWGIARTDGEIIVPVRRNRYQAQASIAEDPSAVVIAMNDALSQLSRDIAAKLEAALRDQMLGFSERDSKLSSRLMGAQEPLQVLGNQWGCLDHDRSCPWSVHSLSAWLTLC